jgi:hypothetical protein
MASKRRNEASLTFEVEVCAPTKANEMEYSYIPPKIAAASQLGEKMDFAANPAPSSLSKGSGVFGKVLS